MKLYFVDLDVMCINNFWSVCFCSVGQMEVYHLFLYCFLHLLQLVLSKMER